MFDDSFILFVAFYCLLPKLSILVYPPCIHKFFVYTGCKFCAIKEIKSFPLESLL